MLKLKLLLHHRSRHYACRLMSHILARVCLSEISVRRDGSRRTYLRLLFYRSDQIQLSCLLQEFLTLFHRKYLVIPLLQLICTLLYKVLCYLFPILRIKLSQFHHFSVFFFGEHLIRIVRRLSF